ncbi:MAG: Zinc transporter ZupT [Firmicutes bacterium ADurb.Bin456]|nr:MAG: Zinc transporter ZupT [Firmicutes bacterium ADurb.Bin456]
MGGIILLGLVAGLGTCLGALLVIAWGELRPGALSLLLGLASGIMFAVILLDLLPSSLKYGNPVLALKGFLGGTLLLAVLDLFLRSFSPAARPGKDYLKMGYLIALGIALHDLPEGFAIAAGFAAAEKLGPILVISIGLHNIPEGMATAAPLRYGACSAAQVLAISILISLVTPLGTFLGLILVEASRSFIGLLLAFAAGAMTYIVLGELAPEAHRGSKALAGLGMITGFLVILALGFVV